MNSSYHSGKWSQTFRQSFLTNPSMIQTTIAQLQEVIDRAKKNVDDETPIEISAVADRVKAVANGAVVAYVGPINPTVKTFD